jgi:RND family efflux transporter MFP subunit
MELTPLKADGAGGGTVTIDPVIVQNMGVRTAEVQTGPLVQSVRVVGYLEEPEPLHRDINLRVNGWIEKLYANIDGMVIEDGQPLFDLYSPELTVAIDEMISAAKQLKIAPEDETSRSLIDASRRKLLQYGLTEGQVTDLGKLDAAPQTVPIVSPMGGHLTAKMVYEGASVKSGDLVLRIASRHRMWIDAQVHEQQMPLLSDGQGVRATLVSQPGKVYNGKLLFVHPHLDPKTRTALARIEIDNSDLHLRQGMYATVEIAADDYREATVVPREAVIDTGRRQLAFVDLGDGRFEPRELKLGLSGQGDTVEVLEGIKPGERIVTSGQFLLDSESRLKEAVAKHLSGGLGGHAGGANAPGKAETQVPVAPVTKVTVPHTDDIVKAYLPLAKKLGERQADEKPIDPAALVDIATMAAGHASGEAKVLAQAVSDAAAGLKGKPIAEQRKGFIAVSDAILALVRASTPSNGVAPTLFVMYCPMAFDDKGAHWLQDTDALANPYYATAMKRCGEVREQIVTEKK